MYSDAFYELKSFLIYGAAITYSKNSFMVLVIVKESIFYGLIHEIFAYIFLLTPLPWTSCFILLPYLVFQFRIFRKPPRNFFPPIIIV